MSLISSLPFCVEEFAHMDFAYDKYMVPYYNGFSDADKTGFKGTFYPLALTKEQVHALYWKVVLLPLAVFWNAKQPIPLVQATGERRDRMKYR